MDPNRDRYIERFELSRRVRLKKEYGQFCVIEVIWLCFVIYLTVYCSKDDGDSKYIVFFIEQCITIAFFSIYQYYITTKVLDQTLHKSAKQIRRYNLIRATTYAAEFASMIWLQETSDFFGELDLADSNFLLKVTGIVLWCQIGFWILIFTFTFPCFICRCDRDTRPEPNYGYDDMLALRADRENQ